MKACKRATTICTSVKCSANSVIRFPKSKTQTKTARQKLFAASIPRVVGAAGQPVRAWLLGVSCLSLSLVCRLPPLRVRRLLAVGGAGGAVCEPSDRPRCRPHRGAIEAIRNREGRAHGRSGRPFDAAPVWRLGSRSALFGLAAIPVQQWRRGRASGQGHDGTSCKRMRMWPVRVRLLRWAPLAVGWPIALDAT